jgi:hypothetical protein
MEQQSSAVGVDDVAVCVAPRLARPEADWHGSARMHQQNWPERDKK